MDNSNKQTIPIKNPERATNFYKNAFGITLEIIEESKAHLPSNQAAENQDESLPYLTTVERMKTVLARLEAEGGKVIMPKTLITHDTGYMAVFLDPEGNKVALHSHS